MCKKKIVIIVKVNNTLKIKKLPKIYIKKKNYSTVSLNVKTSTV